MRLGVLFSGGKDSTYAAYIAGRENEIVCLITLEPMRDDSYMFHTPNISIAKMSAEAMGLPIVYEESCGIKEKELDDLKRIIKRAKDEHGIEGIVTGAIGSTYQASRIQRICDELSLWCFNPLWQKDQVEHLYDLRKHGFDVMIIGVFGFPFTRDWLGRMIDEKAIWDLKELQAKYRVHPAGEGGEIETLVVDSPMHKRSIAVIDHKTTYSDYQGTYLIRQARLVER